MTLLAADTSTLAAAVANKVKLAVAPFVPSPGLDPTTLTEASFPGYTALDPTAGTQLSYVDPLDGLRTIEFKEPLGGWHFACTGTPSPPQTVYGWYITDSTGATLLGCGLLPVPVPFTGAGQALNLPTLTFKFSNQSPF
jgi:hypothetical protein